MVHDGTKPDTVTVASQDEEFPHASVTVSLTVLSPISEQLNELLEIASVTGLPQLSALPLLISAGVMDAVPFTRVTVIFLQAAVGGVLSPPVFEYD